MPESDLDTALERDPLTFMKIHSVLVSAVGVESPHHVSAAAEDSAQARSGCSVMVAGDPKSPIVTHGGTASSRSKLTDENAFTAWSFYLQKTVTFTFTRLRKKKGTLSTSYVPAVVPSRKGLAPGEKATMIEDQKTASVTIEVVRFFPGNGKAAASALLPPSQVKAILESYL
jgi:hypothetical protein